MTSLRFLAFAAVPCLACARGRVNYSPLATVDAPCEGRRVLAVYNNTPATLQVYWGLPGESVPDVLSRGPGPKLGTAQAGTTYFPVPGPGFPFVLGTARTDLYRLSLACETVVTAPPRAA